MKSNKGKRETEDFLKEIEEMTESNRHSERLERIAHFFELERFMPVFNCILEIHNSEKTLNPHLLAYRYEMEQKMYDEIQRIYGKETLEEIKRH